MIKNGGTENDIIETPAYQLFQILITGAEKDKKAYKYFKENFIDVLHTLIDENDTEYIEKLLATDLMPEKN